MQEAKIIAYHPKELPLEQKCNSVGMAEGVYNFCHTLLAGPQEEESETTGEKEKEKEEKEEKEEEKERGWQTVFMDTCTLILSEVE